MAARAPGARSLAPCAAWHGPRAAAGLVRRKAGVAGIRGRQRLARLRAPGAPQRAGRRAGAVCAASPWPPPPPPTARDLFEGAEGNDVLALQDWLAASGYLQEEHVDGCARPTHAAFAAAPRFGAPIRRLRRELLQLRGRRSHARWAAPALTPPPPPQLPRREHRPGHQAVAGCAWAGAGRILGERVPRGALLSRALRPAAHVQRTSTRAARGQPHWAAVLTRASRARRLRRLPAAHRGVWCFLYLRPCRRGWTGCRPPRRRAGMS